MPANTYAVNRPGHRPFILMHALRVGRAGPTQDGRPCPSRLPRVALPETALQQGSGSGGSGSFSSRRRRHINCAAACH